MRETWSTWTSHLHCSYTFPPQKDTLQGGGEGRGTGTCREVGEKVPADIPPFTPLSFLYPGNKTLFASTFLLPLSKWNPSTILQVVPAPVPLFPMEMAPPPRTPSCASEMWAPPERVITAGARFSTLYLGTVIARVLSSRRHFLCMGSLSRGLPGGTVGAVGAGGVAAVSPGPVR